MKYIKSFRVFESESLDEIELSRDKVEEVFRMHSDLAKIGTVDQYFEYLQTIFPNTVLKDIVYHGSNYQFDRFEEKKNSNNVYREGTYKAGWFFAKDKETAESYIDNKIMSRLSNWIGLTKDKNPTLYHILLDVENPMTEDRKGQRGIGFNEVNAAYDNGNDAYIAKNVIDPNKATDVYVVFDPDKIYILGSNKDTKNFKDFVENNSSEDSEKPLYF